MIKMIDVVDIKQNYTSQILNTCNLCNHKYIHKKCSCLTVKTTQQEREYRLKHKDTINKRRRNYRKQHGELVRAIDRNYREKNKDKINKQKRENYHANLDYNRMMVRERARKNKKIGENIC